MALMDRAQIMEIIPHRDPFLLIDEIESMDEEKGEIAAIKYVRESEYYFEGHFPQKKVMPGVLIIEALAQVGAVAILTEAGNQGKLALFGGIKNARFKQQVRPGDVLELSCQLTARRGPVGFGTAEARVDGKLACKAELTFALTDKPE